MFALCLHTPGDSGGAACAVTGGPSGNLQVGRQKRCWMRLPKDLEVSSVHAEFRVRAPANDGRTEQPHVLLCDLQSTNGSKLNGVQLAPRQEYALADQDLIHFGKTALRFHAAKALEIDEPAAEKEPCISTFEEAASSATEAPRREEDSVSGELSTCEEVSADRVCQPTDSCGSSVRPPGSSAAPALASAPLPRSPTAHQPQERVSARSGGGFTADDDEFEAPSASRVSQLPASASISALLPLDTEASTVITCMICGQWLEHLDMLEQQFHINGCLDGRTNQLRDDDWYFLQQQPNATAARNTRNPGRRKRKRTREDGSGATLGNGGDDDEVAMAVALSKSIANREQEVDMDLALLSGELAQIDSQMAKLAKKRGLLLKKMAKLEKTKAKVKRSVVLLPAEARALLNLSKALQVLFPGHRQALSHRCTEPASTRVRAVAERYRPQTKLPEDGDITWSLPSMWLRASQQLFRCSERELYRNSILLPFDCGAEVGANEVEESKELVHPS